MNPENQIILLSAKLHPSDEEMEELNRQLPLVDDWEEAVRSLIARGVGPLFYSKLSQLPHGAAIPAEAVEMLRQSYYLTLSRGMVLQDVFRKVAGAFTAAGIRVVALKGIHLAEWLYGDIGLRQLSDIDILVRKEDGEQCMQLLAGLGFVQSGDEVSHTISEQLGIIHYPAMLLRDVSVEIHINLYRAGEPYTIDIRQLIDNAVPITLAGVPVHALELHDLLIYGCIHLHKHFAGGDIQFTSFSDLVNLLDIHAAEIDWPELDARCRAYHCEEVVYKYLALIHKYFRVSIPAGSAVQLPSPHREEPGVRFPYLSAQDEELFNRYLNGYKSTPYGALTHIENIRKNKGLRAKFRYFVLVVFPGKAFMRNNYRMKYPQVYWLYYPIRHWKGVKGMFKTPNP